MVPVRVVEIVPVFVVEIVPVLVVEIVPALVVEMVPVFAYVVMETAVTNTAAQTIDLTFFIAFAPGDSSQGYMGRLGGVNLLSSSSGRLVKITDSNMPFTNNVPNRWNLGMFATSPSDNRG